MTSSSTKKSSMPLIAGVLMLLIAVAALAFFLSGRSQRRAFTPLEQEAARMMSSDLEGLRLAEAATYRTRGRYIADAEEAGAMRSIGVNPPVIHVTDNGWTATITAPAVPNVQCAIGVDEKNPLDRSTASGKVFCK